MSPGAYNQYIMVLVCQEHSLFWIPFNNIHWGGGLPFGWCGVITFTQSRRVTSCIHPVLGWPDRYSTTMAIIANMYRLKLSCWHTHGFTSAWNPTRPLFCSARWCLMAHRLCPVTWLEQASHRKKSHHLQDSTFLCNWSAPAGYKVQFNFLQFFWLHHFLFFPFFVFCYCLEEQSPRKKTKSQQKLQAPKQKRRSCLSIVCVVNLFVSCISWGWVQSHFFCSVWGGCLPLAHHQCHIVDTSKLDHIRSSFSLAILG